MAIVRLPKYPGAYGVVVLAIGMGVSLFLAMKRPEMWYLGAAFGALCLVFGAILARAKGELVLCTSCGGRDALDEAGEKKAELETREKQAAELRASLEAELKPAIESTVKAKLQREMEGAAGAAVRARLEQELKGELETAIRQSLAPQLRTEIEAELRPAIEAELAPAIEARVKTALEAELRPAIEREVRADVERLVQQQRAAAKPEPPKPEPVKLEPKPEPIKPEPLPVEPAPPVEPPKPIVARIEPIKMEVRVEPKPEPKFEPEPVKLEPVKLEPKPAPPKVEPAPVAAPKPAAVGTLTEPHKKAARKARVIVSDVLLYDRPIVEQAARASDSFAALDRIWAEAQRTFNESVSEEVRRDTNYLRDAFEDMFKKIRKELKLD
jgi:hypothetical protein